MRLPSIRREQIRLRETRCRPAGVSMWSRFSGLFCHPCRLRQKRKTKKLTRRRSRPLSAFGFNARDRISTAKNLLRNSRITVILMSTRNQPHSYSVSVFAHGVLAISSQLRPSNSACTNASGCSNGKRRQRLIQSGHQFLFEQLIGQAIRVGWLRNPLQWRGSSPAHLVQAFVSAEGQQPLKTRLTRC